MSQFASISYRSLALVMQHHQGQLVETWFTLLNSSKVELISAALHAIAIIFDQTEIQYLENEKEIFVTDTSASSDTGNNTSFLCNLLVITPFFHIRTNECSNDH